MLAITRRQNKDDQPLALLPTEVPQEQLMIYSAIAGRVPVVLAPSQPPRKLQIWAKELRRSARRHLVHARRRLAA
jgi:hypothetical protein